MPVCSRCQEDKPDNEYYFYHETGDRYPACKACVREYRLEQAQRMAWEYGKDTPKRVAQKMERHGIPVMDGTTVLPHLSLFAYGCVRVQTQRAYWREDVQFWFWKFTDEERERGFLADVLVLWVPENDIMPEQFMVVPTNWWKLYSRRTGTVKSSIGFRPDLRQSSGFSTSDARQARDNWDLITRIFEERVALMRNGQWSMDDLRHRLPVPDDVYQVAR